MALSITALATKRKSLLNPEVELILELTESHTRQTNHPRPTKVCLSQIHLLISKISHICQEIHDIKSRRKPKSNSAGQNYTSTILDKGQTSQNYTQEPDSSNSAKEGSNGEDGWGETCSSCSTLHHSEPNNPNTPSCHAPIPPSPNLAPSESIQEPPGDLSPSPTSRIGTLIPSLLV